MITTKRSRKKMLVLNGTGMLWNSFVLVLSRCVASKDREMIPYFVALGLLTLQVFYVRRRLETEAARGAAGSPCHASWKDVKIPSPELALTSFSSAFLVSFAKKEILMKRENVTLICYIDKSVSDKTSYKIEQKKKGKSLIFQDTLTNTIQCLTKNDELQRESV